MKLKKIIFAICLLLSGIFLFSCEEQIIKLDTPSDLNVIDEVLSWSKVSNASRYSVYIANDKIVPESTTSYSLSDLLSGNYNLKVKAIGDGKKYLDSDWSAIRPYSVELELKEYIIIFDSNKPTSASGNVTGTMENQSFIFDENKNLPLNSFVLEGWTFTGWNTKADGTGTHYENQEAVLNLTEEETITLYAQWEEIDETKTYQVIFNSNKPISASGNMTGAMTNQFFIFNENKNLAKNKFALEGWIFTGWNTKADGTGTVYEDQLPVLNLTEEQTITLYAQWEKVETRNVKFYGPDNTVIKQEAVVVGSKAQRPVEIELQAYYDFVNWYTDTSYAVIFNFDNLITSDLSIYGKWVEKESNHYPYIGNYYVNIDFFNFTKTEEAELLTLLKKQADRSYSSSYWAPCENSARDPQNSSNVILIYNSASVPATTHSWNKEHVWPQSLMPKSIAGDQHNLFPCNSTINSTRGNLPFVDSSGTHKKVGSKYYPGDEWRGEVARALMYMAFRYSSSITLSTLIDPATALKWHEADPVTKWEMDRNNILINSGYQNNRNPFVDHPELAFIIYGTLRTASSSVDTSDSLVGFMVSVIKYAYVPLERKFNIMA